MAIKVNKHFDVNVNIQSHSTYNTTMARFEKILNNKIGVKGATSLVMPNNKSVVPTQGSNSMQLDDPISVLSSSDDSVDIINKKLEGTPMEGLGRTFKAAENETGINAYALAAIAVHESAYGKSSIAKDKHNLFGFTAYDDNPYTSAKSYASFHDSIFDAATYIKSEYLSQDGKYYSEESLNGIGKHYATDPKWSTKVRKVLNALMNET